MVLVETTLDKALETFPILQSFTLVGNSESYGSSMNDVMEWEAERMKRITALVAVKEEKPIAWSWILHETSSSYSSLPDRYLVTWVFVSPENRRQKVGSALAERAKEIARHRHRPLIVEPWNHSSRMFFKALKMKGD